MLRKMFVVLLALALLLFAAPALAVEWQTSTVVRLQEKKLKFDRQETVAGGQLVVPGKTFMILIDQYPELIGAASGKKLRVSSTPAMLSWMNQVLPRFGDENLVVKKVTGSGLSGARWALKLNFTANTMSGATVRGTLQIGALRTKILSSAKATIPVEGGSIALKKGPTITVDPGFFAQAGSVDVRLQRDPLSKSLDITAVSDTTIITFSSAMLKVDSSALDESGLVVKWVPVMTQKSQAVPQYLPRNTVKRIVVSTISDRKVLYGVAATETHISKEDLASLIVSDQALTIELSDVQLQDILGRDLPLELFHWDEKNQEFLQVLNWEVDSSRQKQVVVMLHGWQPLGEGFFKKDPHLATWEPLLRWATSPMGSNSCWSHDVETFDFYSVRYSTEKSVFDNAVLIQNALVETFKEQPIVILGHSMGGLVGHVMYQKYHPTLANAYFPWGAGTGIARLVTLGTPFHGSPLVQVADDHVGCGLLGPDETLVDASDLFLRLDTPGASSLRWDGLDGRQVGSPNVELAQLNAGLPDFIPEYRTFAGVLSSDDHSLKYRGGNNRMKNCYPEHASDGVVPVVSAHCRRFTSGQSIVRSTEVAMSGPGYGTDFDHTQLWEGRFGEDSDPVHFSTILDQLNLRTPYQFNLATAQNSGSSIEFDFGEQHSPTSLMLYARNINYTTGQQLVKILCANGDQRVEELDVEVEIVQSGSDGWAGNTITYFDETGVGTNVFTSLFPGKNILKMKTNSNYTIEIWVSGGSVRFQDEMRFKFPTR